MPFARLLLALAVASLACRRTEVAVAPAAAAPTPAAPRPAARAVDLTGYRTAYDLLANRVHALVHLDGRLVMTPGDPSFLKFVDGAWKTSWILGQSDAGKPAAFVSGLSATFFAPIDGDGDGVGGHARADVKLRITLRAVVARQRLSIFANEKPVGTIEVGTTVEPHEVTVPAATLVSGENRFRLTFRAAGPIAGGKRSAAAVERIELGPATAFGGAPSQPASGIPAAEVELGGVRRRAFAANGPSRLSFYVQVPPAAKLALSYGASGVETSVVVRVARDGGAPVTLLDERAAARWTDGAWDLAAFASQAVRIDLVTRGGAAAWAAPRIVARAPDPSPLAAHKFERIYVWMVDTLRADKVHAFNPKTNVQTPSYDAFAADATRFAWAAVPGTWSLPSHASILTGVYPSVHKATAHEARLAREVPFVAELMKKAGYRTAMFSSNGYVSSKWGFDRGWDVNRNFIRESLPNGADYLWKQAKAWVEANKGKPQFAYLATVEPHVIYNPKKEFLVRYWNKPYKGPIKPVLTGIQLGQIKAGKLKVDDTDKAYLEALHNAEITQSDVEFAAFIADLKAAGSYDKSAIIVISDHGDEFWDHGDVGHAQSVHQELVHVPLIVRAPGVLPAGKVVESDVEAMDLFATVLDLAGLVAPKDNQGASLLPLAADELSRFPGTAWSQNTAIGRGLKVGRYRFISAGRLELYDELADPREKEDVSGKRPIALRQMRNVFSLLVAFENRWRKATWGPAANVTEAFYSER